MSQTRFLNYRVILIAIDSGGSATLAVEILKAKGVPEDRILFLNLIASPSGVADFAERFPKLRVVTAFIDQGLDEKKLIHFYSPFFRIISLTGCYNTGTLSPDLVILATDTIHCDAKHGMGSSLALFMKHYKFPRNCFDAYMHNYSTV